jgi:hypothetical protein
VVSIALGARYFFTGRGQGKNPIILDHAIPVSQS